MSRSKTKEIERLRKRCKQMERCGQTNTVHHQTLEKLLKPAKQETEVKETKKSDYKSGGNE